jgi:uncharacterized RDD family membrane protein YckC
MERPGVRLVETIPPADGIAGPKPPCGERDLDDRLDTTAAISTPERVVFRFRIAGPGRRGAAWAIDALLMGTILAVCGLIATALAILPGFRGLGAMGGMLAAFAIQWFFGAMWEGWTAGRTPGKMALGLRVIRDDGSPVTWREAVLRNLLRGVDALPVFGAVGVASMAIDRQQRRIGDLVAGTLVVCEERAHLLGAVVIDPPVTEDERRTIPARIPMARHEIALVEEMLRRRRQLSDERMEELSALLAPRIAEQTGLSSPTWRRSLILAYARATGRDREEAA